MVIQHNMAAANTNRMLGATTTNLAKSTEKLSSGYKINRAGDDAAGLSISEKMRAQVRGLDRASDNAQDGISLLQTAEGALNETTAILQRMRELTVQASTDTNESVDRDAIKKEITALTEEIDRISADTEFNGKKLLDGSLEQKEVDKKVLNEDGTVKTEVVTKVDEDGKPVLDGDGKEVTEEKEVTEKVNAEGINVQVGANRDQKIAFSIEKMDATSLGVAEIKDQVSKHEDATAALDTIDAAIKSVSNERSKLGAVQNRLEHTISNLDNISENVTAAESRIRDVDMAEEMVKYSKNNILQQAAQSMLSQANQQSQGVLSLLR